MNCDIIRDLMPGYIDDVLTETSASAVREHLEGCGECRCIFTQMKEDMIIHADKTYKENALKEQTALDGFKKIRNRTRYFKVAAAVGGILMILLVIGAFCKIYVWGSLLEDHMVNTTGFQYDEQTDSLTIKGYMDIDPGHVSRVVWKENPGQWNRIDLFVYAAENLPFGTKVKEFSITIPDMKGKIVCTVGCDYEYTKVYDWQNDHYKLMMELEQTVRGRFSWDESQVMLIPTQGIYTVDGAEGIEYSVFFLEGEDAYYYRVNDTYVTHGDVRDAGHVWISLDEPHQIDMDDLKLLQ